MDRFWLGASVTRFVEPAFLAHPEPGDNIKTSIQIN
jgi:hypothetical protein